MTEEHETLRKLQLTQLEMLKMVDEFCEKHNISYSLYGGTLLGAVRHHGFIPWDDDLDICMAREEYNRFIALWLEDHPQGYILQNKENTPTFTQSFTKIRKEHTTFLQSEREKKLYHTGIFIDIFPLDRIPSNKFAINRYKLNCMVYQLFTKEFIPPKANKITRFVSSFFLNVTRANLRTRIRNRCFLNMIKYDKNKQLNTIGIDSMESLGIYFPPEMQTEFTKIEFENNQFMCFKDWDTYLKLQYGDYMKLPPEEERTWKHHPIILDFDKDYDERTK